MELTPTEEFQYKMWEPPTRSELPETIPGIIHFRRSDATEEAWITLDDGDSFGAEATLEQKIAYHSPTGLEFGYYGSGPADTALNILVRIISPKEACRLHQHFKEEVIARIPRKGGELKLQEVLAWIRTRYAIETSNDELMMREKEMRADLEEIARLDAAAAAAEGETRQAILTMARATLQTTLSDPSEKPEDWKELSEGLLIGVNATLRSRNLEETDLEHLLPSFTSDPTLITYRAVMERAK